MHEGSDIILTKFQQVNIIHHYNSNTNILQNQFFFHTDLNKGMIYMSRKVRKNKENEMSLRWLVTKISKEVKQVSKKHN